MNNISNENSNCLPANHRGKSIEEVDAILLLRTSSKYTCFISGETTIVAYFYLVDPSRKYGFLVIKRKFNQGPSVIAAD